MPSGVATWIYGSRFDTTSTSSPANWLCNRSRSLSGSHICEPLLLPWRSRLISCSSPRKSPTMGRSSGGVGDCDGRKSSPRNSPLTPFTQPRQLRCAMNTVISEITTASRANSEITYFFVSLLRRSIKLMSCTRINLPRYSPSLCSGLSDRCTEPSCSFTSGLRTFSVESRIQQPMESGYVEVLYITLPLGSQNANAYKRSSWTARSNSCVMRLLEFLGTYSSSGSPSALASDCERMSRSRMNHRNVMLSIRGTTVYAMMPSTTASGKTKRNDSRNDRYRMDFSFLLFIGQQCE